MELNEQLFADPTVRSLLWCLLCAGNVSEQTLLDNCFTQEEAQSILADPAGHLRAMQRRLALANALTPERLAALLRSRLSEFVDSVERSAELSAVLRSLKGLPDWLFPQWGERSDTSGSLASLLGLAAGLGAGPAAKAFGT